ncbi:MAG: MATE family efflux transporter, partial [Clostridiales bacterium]|nr:MATE family efflux transporter [Clostridiales bacterium]
EYFCYFVLNAFVQTTMTFTGQNYGAGNMKRCRKIWIMGMLMGTTATLAFNLIFFAGKTVLIGLFTGVPAVAAWAYIRMKHVLLFQWIANSYEITGAAMRGMGHSTLPALISVLGTCVMRILWILTIFRQSGSFEMLMDIYPITWVITGAVTLTAYFIVRSKEEKAAVSKLVKQSGE